MDFINQIQVKIIKNLNIIYLGSQQTSRIIGFFGEVGNDIKTGEILIYPEALFWMIIYIFAINKNLNYEKFTLPNIYFIIDFMWF